MHHILIDLVLFSAAAVIFVPLFRYFGLGAILAYLFGGILIGPHVLGFVEDPTIILHFSELGVVFLLFIIGLELAPKKLWRLRHSIFGLGMLQLMITGALFYAMARLFGLDNNAALVAGFGLALSSTAFAIQILEENRQLNTTHGQGAFSILMFQDLAVVPLLAMVTLLAGASDKNFGILEVAKVIGSIVGVVLVGRFLIRHILRVIADSRTQEVFTAMTLFIVIGTALLMESVGLSMGMGAFLAGVLLAESEYRHELETNLIPFKGLLLGLFFIAVGMSLQLDILVDRPLLILAIAIVFTLIKGIVIYLLARLFRFRSEEARSMGFTLPQGGEFAFVLFASALTQKILEPEVSAILNASVTLSMAATPFLFSWNQKQRKSSELSERPYDTISDENPEVILAGYGRFGQIVARILHADGMRYTILEHDPTQVEIARRFGIKVYYGDASRVDILEAAGAKSAKYLVIAIDDPEKTKEAAEMIRKHFPELKILARVRNRRHAIELMEQGVESVHRETFLSSLGVAKQILLEAGREPEIVKRKIDLFIEHDEKILRQQYNVRDNEKSFVSYTTQAYEELVEILRADRQK